MNSNKIIIVITMLIASALACNLPAVFSPAKPTQTPIPTLPPAEQQSLQNQIIDQINSAPSGSTFTIELDESQVTSLINMQTLSTQDAQASNIQITLENNQAQISADVAASGLSGNAKIVLAVSADAQGKPQMTVVSATLGSFPIPEGVLSTITTSINQALQNQAGQNVEIMALAITDHKLIITAKKN
jgi:hypothetical protein